MRRHLARCRLRRPKGGNVALDLHDGHHEVFRRTSPASSGCDRIFACRLESNRACRCACNQAPRRIEGISCSVVFSLPLPMLGIASHSTSRGQRDLAPCGSSPRGGRSQRKSLLLIEPARDLECSDGKCCFVCASRYAWSYPLNSAKGDFTSSEGSLAVVAADHEAPS